MVIFDGGRCPGGQMSYCFTLRRRARQGNREDDVEDIIRTARSEHAANGISHWLAAADYY